MLEQLLTYINDQNLFDKTDKIVLAVSGGLDSVVLAELFKKAKFTFAIAHVNFALRGEESAEDEVFVKKMAQKMKVPFFTTTFQTEEFAKENGLSIQVAARQLRYTWFNELLLKENYNYIATAHHLNDTAETLLLNIAKGTGIAGLHGILPKRGQLIRPLMFADREQILEYVVENQIIWREDSSNESQKYQRNFIRQEIMPKYKEINPNFEDTIKKTIEKVGDLERYFHFQVEVFKKNNLIFNDGNYYLSFLPLIEHKEFSAIYSAILGDFNFNFIQIQSILSAINSDAGKSFLSATHDLVKDRTDFVIKPKNIFEDYGTMEIDIEPAEIEMFKLQNSRILLTKLDLPENFKPNSSKKTATLDFDSLKSPLKIRKWKEGDWFCPLGMNKKKNISDLLNAEKIPANLKKDIYVITSNGSIVWVVGVRIDNRFKVTEKTKKVLFIERKY